MMRSRLRNSALYMRSGTWKSSRSRNAKTEEQITAQKKRTRSKSRSTTTDTLSGQKYDDTLGIAIPFTDSITAQGRTVRGAA
jgi:hypothetical protein